MRKNLSKIFLIFFFASFSAMSAKISSCEKVTIDGQEFYMYKVGSRENLADVSRRFNVSEEEILAANYLVSQRGLRRNETLKVPVKEGVDNPCEQFSVPQVETQAPISTTTAAAVREVQQLSAGKRTLKVAYFMPFALTEVRRNAPNDRFMEFYQGSLLAIEQLKNEGVSFEIYAYDTGTDERLLNNILAKPEIRDMDMFIGPIYTNQVKRVSDYSKRFGIRHVVPFSAQTTETAVNPMIFQCNIAPAQQAEEAARRFVDNFKGQPIVVVEFNTAQSSSERIRDFITVLKRELNKENVAYQTVFYESANSNSLTRVLTSNRENIVVLGSADVALLTETIAQLKGSEQDFALFGMPEWLTVNGIQEKIFACKLYLYTPFYIDNTDADMLRFRQAFTSVFGTYNRSSLPFYNFYGYDVSMYFLSALARFGRDFERNLPTHNVTALQSYFNFERIGQGGGFVNNGLWLLRYEPDTPVVRRPF